MTLREKFYGNLQTWEEHCKSWRFQLNSSQTIRDCKSYKNLVTMGKDILPYIKEVYETKIHEDSTLVSYGLATLVKEIVGESFEIPEEIQGKMDETKDYTCNWLDANC